MRILHLVSYPLFSGAVPPTVGLALAQRAQGHAAWVAVDRKRGHLQDPFEEPAAPRIAAAHLAPDVALTLSTHGHPWDYIRDIHRLRAFVQHAAVDVVHVHQSHDHGLATWLAGGRCRLVRTIHAPRSLTRRFGQRWLYRRADGIIVRCRAHLATLIANHAPSAPVVMLPGSIDAPCFAQADPAQGAAVRAAWGVPADAPLLGMVALLAGRGQAELLHAVARLADARLHVVLVGRGSHAAELRALAEQLGLGARVHFAGYLQGQALVSAYAACDALFLAQAGNDASARAALEAMAAGKPLLAVATDALADLVDAEMGWRAENRAPEVLAALLGNWLANPVTAARRAQLAQRFVLEQRQFAQEADATLDFYASLNAGS